MVHKFIFDYTHVKQLCHLTYSTAKTKYCNTHSVFLVQWFICTKHDEFTDTPIQVLCDAKYSISVTDVPY